MGNKQKRVVAERKNQKQVVIKHSGSTIRQKPIWRFDKIDRSGKFAFDLSRADFQHREVLQKLMDYGNMTWDEIDKQQHDHNKSKHHYLSYESLSDAARERIKARQFEEDSDVIFSFALQNLLRIVGFRRDGEFSVIWYDPNHEFCPSKK